MKNALWYLIATMTVCLAGLSLGKNMDTVPAAAKESERKSAAISRYVNDIKPSEHIDGIEGIVLPMPMICFPSKQVEEALTKDGFKILSTGLRPDGEFGPELYETWMNSETKNFVILRVVASQGLSCAIASGPLLRPGGVTMQEMEQSKPKGKSL